MTSSACEMNKDGQFAGCSNTNAANPSNPKPDDQKSTVRHDIFLSHSGKQKDFMEHLCKELVRWGYNRTFFDVREDCLPKGKKFPELIFRAARECRVAILILSEHFFTNTKWPMLELEAIVDEQKKSSGVDILPVYFKGLTKAECRNSDNIRRWHKEWKEMEKKEAAEKMQEMSELEKAQLEVETEATEVKSQKGESRARRWKDALMELRAWNGIEYEKSSREAALIDKIVSSVRCLLPPPNMASDATIESRGRICESIIQEIRERTPREDGVSIVGMHGMGGTGKTTFCKELCYQLNEEFEGRVCHAELGRKTEKEMQKEVARKLTDVSHDYLSVVEATKVTSILRQRMAGGKVFLALDNVCLESLEEAKFYLQQVRYGRGSIVVVTARSIDVLTKSLIIHESFCFEMPELEEEDARQLFLHNAAPYFQVQSSDDEKNIGLCIRQCQFQKGGKRGVHFHPLALKVLGQSLHSIGHDPKKWVERALEDNKFNRDRQRENLIFSVLGRGYDELEDEDQILFMDVVLSKSNWRNAPMYSFDFRGYSDNDKYRGVDLIGWLSIVHCQPESSMRDRLEVLQKRALLEDIGAEVHGVHVHDLYLEFGRFQANRGDLDTTRHLVWHEKQRALPNDFKRKPSGNCFPKVERLLLDYHRYDDHTVRLGDTHEWRGQVTRVLWQRFANIVVLVLRIGRNQVLDLQDLDCLRSLTLHGSALTVFGLGKLEGVGWLDLRGAHYETCFQEIALLTQLQVVRVETSCVSDKYCHSPENSLPYENLDLDECINLRELVLGCTCLKVLSDLGRMGSLRRAAFQDCYLALEVRGLSSQLSALEELRFVSCHALSHLRGLGDVVSLQVLEVSCCLDLEELPDLCKLRGLRKLRIWRAPKLALLPQLGALVALEKLELGDLPEVRKLPDMRLLTKLQKFEFTHVPRLMAQLQSKVDLNQFRHLEHREMCEIGNYYAIVSEECVAYFSREFHGAFFRYSDLSTFSDDARLRFLSDWCGGMSSAWEWRSSVNCLKKNSGPGLQNAPKPKEPKEKGVTLGEVVAIVDKLKTEMKAELDTLKRETNAHLEDLTRSVHEILALQKRKSRNK